MAVIEDVVEGVAEERDAVVVENEGILEGKNLTTIFFRMAQNQGKEAASTTPMPFPPEIYWKKYTHMNVRKGLAPPPPKIPSEPVSVFGQQQVFVL